MGRTMQGRRSGRAAALAGIRGVAQRAVGSGGASSLYSRGYGFNRRRGHQPTSTSRPATPTATALIVDGVIQTGNDNSIFQQAQRERAPRTSMSGAGSSSSSTGTAIGIGHRHRQQPRGGHLGQLQHRDRQCDPDQHTARSPPRPRSLNGNSQPGRWVSKMMIGARLIQGTGRIAQRLGAWAVRLRLPGGRAERALCQPDRQCAGDLQRHALFRRAELPGRTMPAATTCMRRASPWAGSPTIPARLEDNGGRADQPGRLADGHLGPRQGRRAAGGALRHLGFRDGAEIRQQQADLRPARRRGAMGALRPASQDPGRPDTRFRLLPRSAA